MDAPDSMGDERRDSKLDVDFLSTSTFSHYALRTKGCVHRVSMWHAPMRHAFLDITIVFLLPGTLSKLPQVIPRNSHWHIGLRLPVRGNKYKMSFLPHVLECVAVGTCLVMFLASALIYMHVNVLFTPLNISDSQPSCYFSAKTFYMSWLKHNPDLQLISTYTRLASE